MAPKKKTHNTRKTIFDLTTSCYDELLLRCIDCANEMGTTSSHRFVFSLTQIMIDTVGAKISVESSADLALVEPAHGAIPRIIKVGVVQVVKTAML